MEKLYILDASGYLYRSYFAIGQMTNEKGESTNALFGFIRCVLKVIKDFQPTHLVAIFDGPKGGEKRKAIYADYKAHRVEVPEDLRYQLQWAREFCQAIGIPFLDVPGVEADDTIGSVATWAAKKGSEVYICSTDKDMAQLVNDHIHLINTFKDNLMIGPKEVEEIYGVSPDKMIDWLAITGDASDNIPGLSGFGPKTATAMLQQFGSLDAMLAHPEQISAAKKRETVVAEADTARLSRKLVLIDIHVPFPQEDRFFDLHLTYGDALKQLYSRMNFNSLLREIPTNASTTTEETQKPTDNEIACHYILVDDEKAFQRLLETLAEQKEVCFDTETTSTRPLLAELVGVGFCYRPGEAWYVPANGQLGMKRVIEGLKELFHHHQIGFYGHNVKYDIHVLGNYGIQVKKLAFDTILASYLLNSSSRQHSLDYLSMHYFAKQKIAIDELIGKGKQQISMKEVPIDKVCTYCCEDVDYTCHLKLQLAQELDQRHLSSLMMDLELPLLKILAEMERTGIYVDVERLKAISKEVAKQIRAMEGDIHEMAGELFNINSPKQLSEILFYKMGITPPRKTATGHSTDAEVLEGLQDQYPIAGKVLEYRTLEKLRGTYLDSLPEEVNPNTGRIHCTFNQSVAATGRLSCQDPNLQNIPIRSEIGRTIRSAFKPQQQGWSFLSADYSQIELRVLAHLSGDPQLVDAFQHNRDVHAYTASIVFGVPLTDVTKEMRHQAKAVNFGVIYGQQAFGLARELHIDVKKAAAFISTYFERYHAVQKYVEECKEYARKHGKAVTITGRERAIPEIHSKNANIRSAAERLAVNTPLQGTAADLIKMAMLNVRQKLKESKLQAKMVLQIHDELLFEVPDTELDALTAMVKECMETVYPLTIPLVADINIGKNWEEC